MEALFCVGGGGGGGCCWSCGCVFGNGGWVWNNGGWVWNNGGCVFGNAGWVWNNGGCVSGNRVGVWCGTGASVGGNGCWVFTWVDSKSGTGGKSNNWCFCSLQKMSWMGGQVFLWDGMGGIFWPKSKILYFYVQNSVIEYHLVKMNKK